MNELYSVRMRAALGGSHENGGVHISGAERIVAMNELESVVARMIQRANQHEKGTPDFINVTIEKTAGKLEQIEALPVSTRPAKDVEEAHRVALYTLEQAGVRPQAAKRAIRWLSQGAAGKGCVMRGAMIMDAKSGDRLEPDFERGVRVSKMDWEQQALRQWCDEVSAFGYDRERVWEAIALATKVTFHRHTVAELCWSDDPGYVTGYVASRELGYTRIPNLKQAGDPLGGRVFFVDTYHFDLESYIHFLKETPVLIGSCPQVPVIG